MMTTARVAGADAGRSTGQRYFAATGAPAFAALNVAVPEFFKALNALVVPHRLAGRI